MSARPMAWKKFGPNGTGGRDTVNWLLGRDHPSAVVALDDPFHLRSLGSLQRTSNRMGLAFLELPQCCASRLLTVNA
jgi:hypothetical protein